MSEHPKPIDELLLAGAEEQVFEHARGCGSCSTALLERSAYAPGCTQPLLGYRVLLHLDLLVEDEPPAELRSHLDACPACRSELGDARKAMAELTPLGGEAVLLGSGTPSPAISLTCVFCHDQLTRIQSVYCASCLAPHHPGCFTEHGRCGVLGCEDTRFVRPVDSPTPPRPPRQRRWLLGGLLGTVVATGSIAALVATSPPRAERSTASAAPEIVAQVGDSPITLKELDYACRIQPRFLELPRDSRERLQMLLDRLDALIEERVLIDRARGEGVTLDEEAVLQLESDLELEAAPYGGEVGLARSLQEKGIPYWFHRQRRENACLIEALIARHVPRELEIPQADVRRAYEQHRARYSRGGETRLREIVFYSQLEDAERRPAALEALVKDWDANLFAAGLAERAPWNSEPFAAVATRLSMASDAGKEQVFDTVDMDQVLLPPLGAVVNGLEVGQISEVVECYTGTLHIVQLVSRKAGEPIPLAEVAGEIRQALEEQSYERRRRAWIEKQREEADVDVLLTMTAGGVR